MRKNYLLGENPKTRLVIYLLGISAQIVSFFVAIYAPDLAEAFSQTADVLGVIAMGTAAVNLDSSTGLGEFDRYDPDPDVTATILIEDAPDDGAAPTAAPTEARHAE